MDRRHGSLAVSLAAVVTLAGCTTPPPTAPLSSTAPGVSKHSIVVGSLSTASGPLAAQFGQIVYGVKAYFDAVNAGGGVNGRQILLNDPTDDAGSPTNDTTQARNLVEQDHVFAVVGVATPFFTGASFFASQGTPVFGYLVSQDWNIHPDLFGAYGSYLDYAEVEPGLVDLTKQMRSKSVAVVAYAIAAQSKDACGAVVQGLQAAHIRVGFQDLSFGLGANPTAAVLAMKAAHIDFLISCLEGADNLSFDEAMHQNGLTSVKTLWLQGYDRDYLKQDPAVMVGAIYLEQHVPFEAAVQFPGRYPAVDRYLKTMRKYEPKWTYNDLAFEGYLNAAQFVQGLKEQAATHKPLTQANLIAALNAEKSFTAGLTTPVDWTHAHSGTSSVLCGAFVQVERGDVLKVIYARKGEVFACVNLQGKLVPPPAGTPGL